MSKHLTLSIALLALCLSLVAVPPMAWAQAASPAAATPGAGSITPAQANLTPAAEKEIWRIANELVNRFAFLYARIYVIEPGRQVYRKVAIVGDQARLNRARNEAGASEGREVSLAGDSLMVRVISTGQGEETAQFARVGFIADPNKAAVFQRATGHGAARVVPIIRAGKIYGIIEVEVERSTFFPRERDIAQAYADQAALLLAAAGVAAARSESEVLTVSAPTHSVVLDKNLGLLTGDGFRLAADVYRPADEGSFPTVVIRTPYGREIEELASLGRYLAQRGYAVVIQDVRGRGASHGKFEYLVNEPQDGRATLQWVASQSWCNGRIALRGHSYEGASAWLACAGSDPAPAAVFALAAPSNAYEGCYTNGAFQFNLVGVWSIARSITSPENVSVFNWEDVFNHLPVSDLDRYAIGKAIPFYRQILAHPEYDSFWRGIDLELVYPQVSAAAVSVSGWYDPYLNGAISNFTGMQGQGGSDQARAGQKLVIGPWSYDINRLPVVGNMDFGPNAVVDLRELELRWYDHYLKGFENGAAIEAPVRIFVMGDNVWRDEQEWPLARTEYTTFYFHSAGKANTHSGDGTISTTQPTVEPPDSYTYDPANPSDTAGGSNAPYAGSLAMGPTDERTVEKRRDVLVYTSAPLSEATEVTGPIQAVIFASSAAQDTDFSVKLVDVYPDGTVRIIQNGIMRARYHKSVTKADLIEPGKIYPYTIDLRATSNVFAAGHQIRVEVASADFYRYDRNLNTGGDNFNTVGMLRATQQIYHDSEHPSHIILPIIPR